MISYIYFIWFEDHPLFSLLPKIYWLNDEMKKHLPNGNFWIEAAIPTNISYNSSGSDMFSLLWLLKR